MTVPVLASTLSQRQKKLYWGRMAALFLRLLYSIFPEVDWQFVYVDDFLWLLRRDTSELLATAILATLTAMGMPLAWHKTAMMETNTWLGFVINTPKAMPSLPAKKYLEISELLQKVEEGRSFLKNDLVSLLGRLQWAVSAAPYCRPLLQPFWSWLKAMKLSGRPGMLVRYIAKLIRQALAKPSPSSSPYRSLAPLWAASDASADPATGQAAIGGWFSFDPEPRKDHVWWFMESLSESTHPWAFVEGNPQKRIAAIELYGSLNLLKFVLNTMQKELHNRIPIPLITDNQSNSLCMLANRTKRWPGAAILMEISMLIHYNQASLAPAFVHRDLNECSSHFASSLG